MDKKLAEIEMPAMRSGRDQAGSTAEMEHRGKTEVEFQVCTEVPRGDVFKNTESRDPHGIQRQLKLDWEHVIAEPDGGPYSFKYMWKCNRLIYSNVSRGCYSLFTFICSPVLVFVYGLLFACQAFTVIWCCSPILKILEIVRIEIQKWIRILLLCFMAPLIQLCRVMRAGGPVEVD